VHWLVPYSTNVKQADRLFKDKATSFNNGIATTVRTHPWNVCGIEVFLNMLLDMAVTV